MFREQLESREEEIIRTLSSLPKRFVLVGGYAVSALSSHRFSADCDIVVAGNDAEEIRSVLVKEGYARLKSARVGKNHGGGMEILSKRIKGGSVSVDLFVDSLTARGTAASWSYDHIRRNSTEATVSGIGSSASVFVPIRELLVATKIHSGRDTDIRDIVMLSEGVDWDSVAKHAARGDREALLKQLTNIIGRMESEQFGSSLRATFELRRNIKPLASSCKKGLLRLRSLLEATTPWTDTPSGKYS